MDGLDPGFHPGDDVVSCSMGSDASPEGRWLYPVHGALSNVPYFIIQEGYISANKHAPGGTGSAVELRVRYSETDQMGVVYHANYLVWCEIARTELIRERLVSYAEVERKGTLLAVSEATIRYHAPARYDDLVRVEAWIDELRSRTIRFGYWIGRLTGDGRGERLVTASTTLIALDRNSRPRSLPPELLAALRDG